MRQEQLRVIVAGDVDDEEEVEEREEFVVKENDDDDDVESDVGSVGSQHQFLQSPLLFGRLRSSLCVDTQNYHVF